MKKSLALLFILCFISLLFIYAPHVSASTPITVWGTVVDRHGNPIAGAKVDLINDEIMGANWNILSTQTTDGNGNFRFVNVLTNSPRIKCLITLTDNGKTYKINEPDSQWTDASVGMKEIDRQWTTFLNYPPPEYGYLWGVVQAEGGNARLLPNAVVYVIANEQKYYSFTGSNGAYEMRLPVGHYRVYAQYSDGTGIYQSSRQVDVDVIGVSRKTEANPLTVTIPLSNYASNPQPPAIPGIYTNTVNGTVTFKGGSGVQGATVSLWQTADSGGALVKKAEATTDASGNYRFENVQVTSDDGSEVFGMKTFRVSASYRDPQGTVHITNKSFPLYHPNVILGIGQSEMSARNMSADLEIDYTNLGWLEIQCNPSGAKVFVDGRPLLGADGSQLTTPCTAYIAEGRHTVKLTKDGYDSSESLVDMKANQQTETLIVQLKPPVLPGWVTLAVAVLILLVVVGLICAILLTKRHMFAGPLAAVLKPLNGAIAGLRSGGAARKEQREARRAQAEVKKAEKAQMAQMADASKASPMLDSRKKEQGSFGASEQRRLPEHAGNDDLSMVSARGIYRKAENPDVERMPHAQATGSMANAPIGRDAAFGRDEPPRAESPITAGPDGRIRVPKSMPVARDQPGTTLRDKERVVRYVREHQDGVSFIQMSNELEIPPNTLTIITKELVINDDVEKVKGLYYYKTHDSAEDEGKSSVVVWRLDGED